MTTQNPFLDLGKFKTFEHFELYAKSAVEGFITGMHKSPFHGFSVEFSEHKIYNPGESTRHIDWKLYGRTDRLYTKRYEEETNLRCHLVMDCSGSMFYPVEHSLTIEQPNKYLASSVAALSLMHLLRKQRDAVGLQFLGNSDLHLKAKGGIPHQKIIAHHLWEQISAFKNEEQVKANTAQSLHLMAERIPKRGLVCLFSDLLDLQDEENFDAFIKALQHLKYQHHEIIIFWTLHHQEELKFEFEDRPYKLIDLETKETVTLNPNDIKANYTQNVAAFEKKLKETCAQYKIELMPFDVGQGVAPVLRTFLSKRGKLF
jgi:uncharacterized protein (DUF58 family)